MSSFIAYLNYRMGSWPEYIVKIGQEQEEKETPHDFDLGVERQAGASRLREVPADRQATPSV
jgi:hypothetical protein